MIVALVGQRQDGGESVEGKLFHMRAGPTNGSSVIGRRSSRKDLEESYAREAPDTYSVMY